MTEKTLTTENIKPALDALRGELAPWPVVAKKQDRLNAAQLNAANSGITSSLVAQIIANTATIRALESAITGTGLRPLVVASLPAIGTQGILYIVPVTTYDPETDADVVNYSNEYIWIVAPDAPVTEGYYEQVGQTGIVINNGQLTITVNGTSVGTFTANQSGDTTAAITVPTNADYVDLSTSQTVTGGKTWTGEQSFTLPIVGSITGTASKAIADEDGTSIKTGYVNVAGNQTVTGQKTWSGNQFFTSPMWSKNTSYEIGNTPASNVVIPIYFSDKNNVYTGYARSVIYTSGRSATEIRAKNAFKNGVLDPTGADISSNLNVEVQPNGAKTIYWDGLIRNNVTPFTPNTNSLGSSTNQWSAVYAQTYYYNGTAWGLDKANVWTNVNTFNGSTNTVVNLQRGGSSYYSDIRFADETSHILGCIRASTELQIGCQRSSNWADGSQIILKNNGSLQFVLNDGTNITNIIANATEIKPTNSVADLGTSTNQWKSVYSQTYYYNGTAWGLDKYNTWSGENTYTNTYLTQKQTGLEEGVLPASAQTRRYRFTDKNDASLGWLQHRVTTSGDTAIELLAINKFSNGQLSTQGSEVLNSIVVGLHGDGSRFLTTLGDVYPDLPTRVCNLGTSTNKWKTLNGVNPGALSLPGSSYIEIDTTNWDKTGATSQSYAPVVHGWLYISIQNIAGNYLSMSGGRGAISMDGTGVQSGLRAMLPVIANESVSITVKTGSIFAARFYPMLGNV